MMDLRSLRPEGVEKPQSSEENKKHSQLKLLELEKKITGRDARDEYGKYDGMLSALQRRCMDALQGELTTDEAQKLEQLRTGVIAARKILKFGFVSNS